MELVRWEQIEGVNRVQSRINELFEDTWSDTGATECCRWSLVSCRGHS